MSNNKVITQRSKDLFELNNKRKKIEHATLNFIDFEKIKKKNENVIFYYEPNMNEGLIGIIAARLKDYFHKPAFVITKSRNRKKNVNIIK